MEATVFNNAQMHVLQMMSYIKTEESFKDLKRVLRDFYMKKVQDEAEKLWDEGILSQNKLDAIQKEHLRTPYK